MDVLSIGILAHNEAAIIGRTLASLAAQSVFDPSIAATLGIAAIEVVVVPNGCSDDTGQVAATALAALPAHVRTSVEVLVEPGKSNAWNGFVHRIAASEATLLTLMDADIEFASPDVLELLVRRLAVEPRCDVATDVAVKDFRGKRRLSLLDRLSLRVSGQRSGVGLCGQLYCGRAEALRSVWLPSGLPVEDGFLAAMLVTDGFTRGQRNDVIACVAGARHFYEPHPGVAGFVRHEARIVVGSVINAWLFAVLWDAAKREPAGEFVRRRNGEDPHWVETVCRQAKAERGRWLVPRAFVLWRLAPLHDQPWSRKALRAPVAVAATLATLPAIFRANAILRRPAARLHW